jgi:hypothetical protein
MASRYPTLLAVRAVICHLSLCRVGLESASKPCTYAPRSATRTRAAPSTCTNGKRPADIRRSMVRSETPSCSAASLLVSSSRPDTAEESNPTRQPVKHWHVLTFTDTNRRTASDQKAWRSLRSCVYSFRPTKLDVVERLYGRISG